MKPVKKKVVAKGADRADVRGDRKAARAQKRYDRKLLGGGSEKRSEASAKADMRKSTRESMVEKTRLKGQLEKEKLKAEIRKYDEGGKLPSYDPKKAAMMRALEAQIKKVKGTPSAKPLVEKYRKLTGTK